MLAGEGVFIPLDEEQTDRRLEREVPDLEAQIEAMNGRLSHPEQIRSFRVIERPLSIAEGELTPNLKVKRKNVEAHFAKEIEEMYRS